MPATSNSRKPTRVRDQLAVLKEQAFGAPGSDNIAPLVSGGGRS